MSREFAPLAFPALPSLRRQAEDAHSRASGHAAGYAAGLRAAEAELASRRARLDAEHRAAMLHESARTDRAIAVLAAAGAALERRVVPVLTEAQDAIAAAALDLAEAIIGVELRDGPTSARAAICRVLGVVDPSIVLTVRLNPQDLEALDDAGSASSGMVLTADPAIARGDAMAELPVGFLDARVGTALARARAAILVGES